MLCAPIGIETQRSRCLTLAAFGLQHLAQTVPPQTVTTLLLEGIPSSDGAAFASLQFVPRNVGIRPPTSHYQTSVLPTEVGLVAAVARQCCSETGVLGIDLP